MRRRVALDMRLPMKHSLPGQWPFHAKRIRMPTDSPETPVEAQNPAQHVVLNEDVERRIFSQKVAHLYSGTVLGYSATLISSLVLAYLLWGNIAHPYLISWLVALYAITLVRFYLLVRYRAASQLSDYDPQRWFTIFTVGIGISGVIWGCAGIWLFPGNSVPHQAFVMLALGGMTAGAVANYSVMPLASFAYVIPALVPMVVRLFLEGDDLHTAMGFMFILYVVLMTVTIRRMGVVAHTSFRLVHENSALLGYYTEAKETTEHLNAELRDLIRQRVAIEMARHETEEQLRTVINHMPMVLFVVDNNGMFRLSEGKGLEVLGLKPGQVVGQSAFEHYRDHPKIVDDLRRALQGASFVDNVSFSDTLVFETHYVPLFSSDGRVLGTMGVSLDVSERNKLERMKREFISTVSHELRTPLTSIIGALGLAASGAGGSLPRGIANLMEIARRNSERLLYLINDILDIDKIESGNMVFHFNVEPLSVLLQQAMESAQGYAAQFHVRIRYENDAPGIYANVDSQRLVQALNNLLSNAIKHSPADADVVLRLSRAVRHGGRQVVRVSVRDNGPGIPEVYRQSIFDKFTQVDSSDARAKGGTGLGLAITKAIVEHHGGTIDYMCDAHGTTFYFEIPERAAEGDNPAAR